MSSRVRPDRPWTVASRNEAPGMDGGFDLELTTFLARNFMTSRVFPIHQVRRWNLSFTCSLSLDSLSVMKVSSRDHLLPYISTIVSQTWGPKRCEWDSYVCIIWQELLNNSLYAACTYKCCCCCLHRPGKWVPWRHMWRTLSLGPHTGVNHHSLVNRRTEPTPHLRGHVTRLLDDRSMCGWITSLCVLAHAWQWTVTRYIVLFACA